jgi:outer membrane lipopolysaccharide assembly protein LptE/RlpB
MRRSPVLLALSLCLAGCGYALVGRGAAIPADIKRIGVPLFKDTTGKASLDQKVTQKVIEELLKRGRVDVVQESTGVDALVEGEITGYQARPATFSTEATSGQPQASRYTITLTARVRYTRTGGKDPVWSHDAFSFSDEYDLGSDPSTFVDREEQALDRLVAAFSRSLVAAMLEAF